MSQALISLFSFLAGIIAGYYLEKVLDRLDLSIRHRIKRRRWDKVNRAWRAYADLAPGMEVVQTGWEASEFSEKSVVVTLEGELAPTDVLRETREQHESTWHGKRLMDNEQVGVFQVDPHRISDSPGHRSHLLLIRARRIHYFDFLATNRQLIHGTESEQALIRPFLSNAHSLAPVESFANPLSVGLTVFCEDGDCVVLTRRTTLESSGGGYFGGLVFNAIGETINPSDVKAGQYNGFSMVSPWNTASRALGEELGFSRSDIEQRDIVLHTLVFDTRILDFKFFGYAVSSLSREEVIQRWRSAPDKSESKELFFKDVRARGAIVKLLADMCEHQGEWTSEALVCTPRAFLHLDRISIDDFTAVLAERSRRTAGGGEDMANTAAADGREPPLRSGSRR